MRRQMDLLSCQMAKPCAAFDRCLDCTFNRNLPGTIRAIEFCFKSRCQTYSSQSEEGSLESFDAEPFWCADEMIPGRRERSFRGRSCWLVPTYAWHCRDVCSLRAVCAQHSALRFGPGYSCIPLDNKINLKTIRPSRFRIRGLPQPHFRGFSRSPLQVPVTGLYHSQSLEAFIENPEVSAEVAAKAALAVAGSSDQRTAVDAARAYDGQRAAGVVGSALFSQSAGPTDTALTWTLLAPLETAQRSLGNLLQAAGAARSRHISLGAPHDRTAPAHTHFRSTPCPHS
jgi:hypothetical protein